jgi:hypothetical protein
MSETLGSRAGSMFGPYHLRGLLGRNEMGEVYEAHQTVKGQTVALKLISEDFNKDPAFRERLKRDVRTAGRLQTPHVVPIYDYGEIDGQLFVETRLIDGATLDTLLTGFGPMAPPRAVAIISQIAGVLDAAHAAGLMHRDVTPHHILITERDFAYLVDLGIASADTDRKLTQLGPPVNTWKYLGPEYFLDEEITFRADIYALACILYESLTGTPPYASDSATTLVTAHLLEPAPQPSTARSGIPAAFDTVIARGMAKKPEDRYASASDLAVAARHALVTPDQHHAKSAPQAQHAPVGAPIPPPTHVSHAERWLPTERALPFHEDVHFTVYRPRFVRPGRWTPLLAFAHLGEAPAGADALDDPIQRVKQRAELILGPQAAKYAPLSSGSGAGLPEEAEITFHLDLPGFTVERPERTFLWINAFHLEEFQVRTAYAPNGQMARGRLSIYHGSFLLAEVHITMRIDAEAPQDHPLSQTPVSARAYRKIFPSYSHRDTPIVEEFERIVEAFGDRYTRDVRTLRSGEQWNPRLLDLIREADVFQLFWSTNSMNSEYVQQEWRYALGLNRANFVRPTYWEEPMPQAPGLPPTALGTIHFHALGTALPRTAPPGAPTVSHHPGSAPIPRGPLGPPDSAQAPPINPAPPPVWARPPVTVQAPMPAPPSSPAASPASRRANLIWILLAAALLVSVIVLVIALT